MLGVKYDSVQLCDNCMILFNKPLHSFIVQLVLVLSCTLLPCQFFKASATAKWNKFQGLIVHSYLIGVQYCT